VLKLIYDELLSSFAFKFNLRRYTVVPCCVFAKLFPERRMPRTGLSVSSYADFLDYLQAKVGRCRLTP